MNVEADVIHCVSVALGRTSVPDEAPRPPVIDESIVRLVERDADVVARFVRSATAAKMQVRDSSADSMVTDIAATLRSRGAARIVLTRSGCLEGYDVAPRLRELGFDVTAWPDCSRDALYAADAGITDVWFAVAETGSLVLRAERGRSVSLVPPLHIAVIERSQIVPDLIDAMSRIAAEGAGTGTVFITGPSKTSDIEMTLVTGIHGPMEVIVLLL